MLAKQPLVTVIIPVYNVEEYIERCLNSILAQDYNNIELIIIDDGSTDNSLAVCNRFSAVHGNCQVLIQQNAGQGVARNLGITIASGEFICFVDSDDWIDSDLVKDMVSCLVNETADFVNFGLDFVNELGVVKHSIENFKLKTLQGDQIFEYAMLDNQVLSSPVNKLYRRDLLIENNIYFPEVRACEDMYFSRAVAFYSKRTFFVSRVYYHALIRDGSTSRAIGIDFLSQALMTLDLEKKFLENNGVWDRYSDIYNIHYAKQTAHLFALSAFRIQSYGIYSQAILKVQSHPVFKALSMSAVGGRLGAKHRLVLFLSSFPRLLRVVAVTLRQLGIKPY